MTQCIRSSLHEAPRDARDGIRGMRPPARAAESATTTRSARHNGQTFQPTPETQDGIGGQLRYAWAERHRGCDSGDRTCPRRSASALLPSSDITWSSADRSTQQRPWRAHWPDFRDSVRFGHRRCRAASTLLACSHGPCPRCAAERERCVGRRRARTLVRGLCSPRRLTCDRRGSLAGPVGAAHDAARCLDAADARSRLQTMSSLRRHTRSARASRTSSHGSRRSSERATTTRRAPCSRPGASASPSTFACGISRVATSLITGELGRCSQPRD